MKRISENDYCSKTSRKRMEWAFYKKLSIKAFIWFRQYLSNRKLNTKLISFSLSVCVCAISNSFSFIHSVGYFDDAFHCGRMLLAKFKRFLILWTLYNVCVVSWCVFRIYHRFKIVTYVNLWSDEEKLVKIQTIMTVT